MRGGVGRPACLVVVGDGVAMAVRVLMGFQHASSGKRDAVGTRYVRHYCIGCFSVFVGFCWFVVESTAYEAIFNTRNHVGGGLEYGDPETFRSNGVANRARLAEGGVISKKL